MRREASDLSRAAVCAEAEDGRRVFGRVERLEIRRVAPRAESRVDVPSRPVGSRRVLVFLTGPHPSLQHQQKRRVVGRVRGKKHPARRSPRPPHTSPAPRVEGLALGGPGRVFWRGRSGAWTGRAGARARAAVVARAGFAAAHSRVVRFRQGRAPPGRNRHAPARVRFARDDSSLRPPSSSARSTSVARALRNRERLERARSESRRERSASAPRAPPRARRPLLASRSSLVACERYTYVGRLLRLTRGRDGFPQRPRVRARPGPGRPRP